MNVLEKILGTKGLLALRKLIKSESSGSGVSQSAEGEGNNDTTPEKEIDFDFGIELDNHIRVVYAPHHLFSDVEEFDDTINDERVTDDPDTLNMTDTGIIRGTISEFTDGEFFVVLVSDPDLYRICSPVLRYTEGSVAYIPYNKQYLDDGSVYTPTAVFMENGFVYAYEL